ncbi:hypothetical protein ERO13_D01G023520v2 [Gossypium hirsutum]|uniref:Knottins-like domain-containing protein n=2 Tax=Gossypium TaxID=3633 RepID=A0A5J5NF82_GOSBA|nr:hypothetical protein [Gossypium barbadense]KAG4160876.1 hypothetical protein ERO13_D01G023520v2 [Gossypium hirsutum]PPE02298.1 hypothetical protein GOBAR_DD00632 [Gossypium barbadense]TYG81787.1 hypothetical protein ES288_D01G033800v1 [Gossypium darwinii]
MEQFPRSISAVVFLMLVLLATEMRPVAADGDKICESPSNAFKGLCLRDDNCDIVCKTEGFPNGDCKGFLRKCVCTKPC